MKDEKKSEIHEILKEYNEDIKRHNGALSEDFRSQLSGVAEGVMMLNEKVERLENTLGEVVHVQKIHTEMIGGVMEDISEIKENLKNKVDRTEFVELKQRVLILES